MIRAVVFDCFGVLSTGWWSQFIDEYFAHDKDLLQRAWDLDRASNAGYIGYDEFLEEICKISGITIEELKKRIGGKSPNRILFDYIRDELKPKYKIGMLSNSAENWLDELFDKEEQELFDAVVLSYEVGAAKPDAVMYNTVSERLGVTNEECLFIDDLEGYCGAAEANGMKAIHHKDSNDTISRIKEVLGA